MKELVLVTSNENKAREIAKMLGVKIDGYIVDAKVEVRLK